MNRRRMRTRDSRAPGALILQLLLFALVFAVVAAGLSRASDRVADEGVRVAEEAVLRAAVSCYAIEGAYPESYEYLCKNYGVAVNEDKYIVQYSVFASNIMPEITVIAKGGAE